MMLAGYFCERCKLDVENVEIRERFQNEGVRHYVEYVAALCGQDHHHRSPRCLTQTISVKVPMSDQGIGLPGRPLTQDEQDRLNRDLKKDDE